ncbi:MAG TPA: Lrp/AsnC family transcriptional regulator [Thermomicrobiales bacterium]|jgi:Lrp/AsnC family leucine-responsive transcriptional regulator|nr:Lrp/AsnC family transcriptional regulator [Thermomicrobiales bacterium]
MPRIDTLDERIIDELQESGRLTMKSLAESVGLSSPAMIERVRRLEDRGVILGYRGVVDPTAIGRPIGAIILAEVPIASIDAFLTVVEEQASIVEAHRLAARRNFMLRIHVAEPAALEQLLDVLGATGACCEADLILSTPLPWKPMTAPEGTVRQRARAARRSDADDVLLDEDDRR